MITMDQIDEFRRRTHSSYEEAKFYLERNNGDLLDAIIDFERSQSGRYRPREEYHAPRYETPPYGNSGFQQDYGPRLASLLQKGFDTRIYVEDGKSVLFNIPVILLLFLIPFWVIVAVVFLFLVMLGYRISVRNVKSRNIHVEAFFNNMSEKMKKTNQSAESSNPSDSKHDDKNKKDGYKEYTVE